MSDNETMTNPSLEQNLGSAGGEDKHNLQRLEKSAWEASVMKKFLSHPLFYIAAVIGLLSILQVSGAAPWLDEATFEGLIYFIYAAALFFFGLAYILAFGASFKNVMLHMVQLGGGLGFIHMAFSALRHFEVWKIAGLFASTAIFALIGVGFGLFWSVFLLLRRRPIPPNMANQNK
ncbi:MAG: hypothetical protein A2117_00965 [Candidatus Wildermuthbacteria bacterium GWA2_46_15]|uniref:Uncharacterized protein n=1 Tax=Candidatus Wildermuthbacteria bacterium GWA2_46_15 TaxID=1802443 RepID=A0A1G2QQ24_9BACT|nr:MAG: hypothetical protein A2117_00965 [Candidatus Wildermuthbacteria bacterium GWA2_46_15]